MTGKVPLWAVGPADRRSCALPSAADVTFAVTPEGSPDTANFTLGAAPPFTGDAVMVKEDELLAWRCTAFAAGDTTKSLAAGRGLNWISRMGCSSITFGATPSWP